MRSPLIAVAACAAVLVLAGCGGGGSSPESAATTAPATATRSPSSAVAAKRSAYASALASLCRKRLASLEAIGNATSPAELTRLLPKQLTVMKRFSAQSKALRAPAAQAKAKKDFDRFYATYLDGQIYALRTLRLKSYNGYFTVVSSALMWQTQAEKTARRIGAVECTRRPFENS